LKTTKEPIKKWKQNDGEWNRQKISLRKEKKKQANPSEPHKPKLIFLTFSFLTSYLAKDPITLNENWELQNHQI
jgi:hypothetical protein